MLTQLFTDADTLDRSSANGLLASERPTLNKKGQN